MSPPTATAQSIRRTYKYRLYPTKAQVAALEEQLAFCCDLYNAALEQRRDAWKRGKRVTLYDQTRDLTGLRTSGDYPGRMACHAQRDPLRRLDRAFQAFFRRCKAGEKPGYPRFRSRARYDSLTWPSGSGAAVRDRRLRLQGVGSLRVRWHREIPVNAEVKTTTVKRVAGRWYVCFSLEVPILQCEMREPASVGLDLGIRNFAALSTGELILGLRLDAAATRRAARTVARRKRGSQRRRKAVTLLARQRQREADRRRDYAHKLSRRLVDTYTLIAVEDLAIVNMRRSARGTVEQPGRNVRQKAGLNRAMAEQSWGQFVSFLEYKAEEAGARVVKVNPRKTSQTCSNCGAISRSKSKVRRCSCGLSLDRDINAARNILALGLGRSLQAPTVGAEVHAVA